MPGLGLGAGLNRQQQNRFNQAAQQGQGQQFLASHPGIQQRTAGNAAVQNFANTGQVGANAAQRFQPGGGQAPGAAASGAPQGSGATGAPKPSAGGGGQQQTAQAQAPAQQPQQPVQGGNYSSTDPATMQAAQDARMRAQGMNPSQMGGPMGPVNMNPAGGNMNQAGMGNLLSQLMSQGGAGQTANTAGMNSAQTGLQGQQQQNLIQMILQAFGNQGTT